MIENQLFDKWDDEEEEESEDESEEQEEEIFEQTKKIKVN